jgi:hypothetical protein
MTIRSDFFQKYRPGDTALDDDETMFLVNGSLGEKYFVIATEVRYEITPKASPD